jgi:DNA (cytosine-5)-methyltransferase 1
MKLKILDLFSGIGGFSLGLEATGHFETAAFCEIEPYCKQVLKKHWPTVPIFDDIRQLKGTDIGTIDIITGGYPCQPFSVAGKQKAEQDPRHLWPEYFRLIQELKPTWVIGENVSGHIKLGLDSVLEDLASEGYSTRTFSISASSIGANHKRERVWTIANLANSECLGWTKRPEESKEFKGEKSSYQFDNSSEGRIESEPGQDVANTNEERVFSSKIARDNGKDKQKSNDEHIGRCSTAFGRKVLQGNWSVEPRVGRVAHGIPKRVDRLKTLGNAVVPHIPYYIGQAIVESYQ